MKQKLWTAVSALAALGLAGLACSPSSMLSGDGSLFKDDFSNDNSGWGVGTDDTSSVEYEGGKLVMKVFEENYFVWSPSSEEKMENIHIEVTAENVGGEESTGFGIMCHMQVVDSYYSFLVASTGEYAIIKTQLARDDEILASGTSDDIKENAESYRIGTDCGNGKLTLYVDGVEIDSVSDDTYTDGTIALFTSTYDDKDAEVHFDDLVVTEIKAAAK